MDNNNDELDDDEHFRIVTSRLGCEDGEELICNFESRVEFTVDGNLMYKLSNDYGVDTNPGDGLVRFELNAEVEQGDNAYMDRVSVNFNVEKPYDDGSLPASTIGIIVGVVCAVVVLIIALGLLFYAKRKRKWCFKVS